MSRDEKALFRDSEFGWMEKALGSDGLIIPPRFVWPFILQMLGAHFVIIGGMVGATARFPVNLVTAMLAVVGLLTGVTVLASFARKTARWRKVVVALVVTGLAVWIVGIFTIWSTQRCLLSGDGIVCEWPIGSVQDIVIIVLGFLGPIIVFAGHQLQKFVSRDRLE